MAFEFGADQQLQARFRGVRITARWLTNVKFPPREGEESTYDVLQRELEGLREQTKNLQEQTKNLREQNSVLNSRRDYVFPVPAFRISHFQQEGKTEAMDSPQEFPTGILILRYLGSNFAGAMLSATRKHPHHTSEVARGLWHVDSPVQSLCLGNLCLENLSPGQIAEKIIANLQIMNISSLANDVENWKLLATGEEEEEEEYNWHCYRCDEGGSDDDAIETVSGNTICQCCFDEYRYTYCCSCERATRHSIDIDDENYCRECATSAHTCDDCDWLTFAAVTHVGDKNVCDDCMENYSTCSACGDYFPAEEGEDYCTDCREEDSAPLAVPIGEIVRIETEVSA